ncbi:hypothetical protein RRG08_051716 [Elysia crispata]|uniref:Uncharacterized protein n=1 Tax=Elysia crispata TaxID=231223 RepID=A0AAE1BCF8_9GAST|nr:hypothetical protein RRG08_051716 [Elysia crispata]
MSSARLRRGKSIRTVEHLEMLRQRTARKRQYFSRVFQRDNAAILSLLGLSLAIGNCHRKVAQSLVPGRWPNQFPRNLANVTSALESPHAGRLLDSASSSHVTGL